MLIETRQKLREAAPQDLQKLANLIHFEAYVHRHLDYRPPLDWVGRRPFLLLEQGSTAVAALACPPDPPQVAWIRLFAATSRPHLERAWKLCWPEALAQLRAGQPVRWAAAIPMQPWFEHLLQQNDFQHTHNIVMLSWDVQPLRSAPNPPGLEIRPISPDDLAAIAAIDEAAFPLLWQNSLEYLHLAYRQAAIATLALLDGQPVGYQISTATSLGGHLARLAVLPRLQSHGIGRSLLTDLLGQFARRGGRAVTVNTQGDNHASLHLYQSLGFERTGEEYPIYQFAP